METKKILLVEDDLVLSKSISDYVKTEGFEFTQAYDGQSAEKAFEAEKFDLLLLDLGLPNGNGIEICRKFRARFVGVPIIIVTAFGDIDTKMIAFETGADDYLVKPFHLRELVAKIKVFLKRAEQNAETAGQVVYGELTIDYELKKIFRNKIEINLTPKEFHLLEFLLRNKKRVVSKEEIAKNVWKDDVDVSHNTIEVYISFLRNKIDKNFDKKLIRTKSGFGYYLDPGDE